MKPSPDFERFWSELCGEVGLVVTEWERIERSQIVSSRGKHWKIDWIRYSSIGDKVVEGWISVPIDHQPNGAGFLWLPGYSYGTPPPDDSNLVEGTTTFAINIHGNPPDAPYVNPAGKNDYILHGIESPETYIYRTVSGHCLKALSVLDEQPEVIKGIGVGGMSQGGGLAVIVAAQSSVPKICCADMPFLADVRTSLKLSHSPAYRALKQHVEHHPEALSTILLFDAIYHADIITVPTWLSAGGKDPACKYVTVETVYEQLKSARRLYEFFPNSGHVFLPEMNAAYQSLIEEYIVK